RHSREDLRETRELALIVEGQSHEDNRPGGIVLVREASERGVYGQPSQGKERGGGEWQRKLVDFTEYRLPDMDRNGVDMQIPSLTSPGIQAQPDPDIAVADARTANDFLADIIKEHPQRFAGLAAIPLQDPPEAAAAPPRPIELGLCGALVNDHTRGHSRDEPQYARFWETLQDLDVPLYIHPNAVPADSWKVVQGYPGMDTAMWSWAPRTGGH